jgi:hypothetical protein
MREYVNVGIQFGRDEKAPGCRFTGRATVEVCWLQLDATMLPR